MACQSAGVADSVRLLCSARLLAGLRREWRPGSPAALAAFLDPKFRVTPTIRLLSDVAVRSVRERSQRDIANAPPRTGKSKMLAVWTAVWALMTDPDMEIMIISNGDDLAQKHSREVREIIMEHHEFLGFTVAADKTAVGRWQVQGRRGGMLAAGITSRIVGHGANLLIMDDVVGGASEADSAAHRRRILTEYQGSLDPRVHPGGSILLVMTRWHEEDLAGALMALAPQRWRLTNVTAVGDGKVPDALGKAPGVAMVSALGFTAEDFAEKRATVGERQWWAQYMGVPKSPEGDLIKQAWLDAHRLLAPPLAPVKTVVAVDPADSGQGDEAGVLAMSLTSRGVSAVIADKSGKMTSDQWASTAVDLAIAVGASEIAIESFAARETYSRVAREAVARATEAGRLKHRVQVTAWPPKGSGRGGGDALARSAALLQALEVGTCVLAGEFDRLESAATSWQAGQHQPDRVAAMVVGHDVLVHSVGKAWEFATPGDVSLSGELSPAELSRGPASVTSLESWMSQKVG